MKTNLIFKRQVNINGAMKVVTRIIPVEIPMIDSGEGWTLSGHTDTIEYFGDVNMNVLPISTPSPVTSSNSVVSADTKLNKFISNVSGTAKLVRSKGIIKIVARRGKSTINQTTPDSVCISDFMKNDFFKDCRAVFGSDTSVFQFSEVKTPRQYAYWSKVIDSEYARQLSDNKENK